MTAKRGDIYLGLLGQEEKVSAFGRTLTISDEILSREERTASGRLVRDIIATKKKITLAYETISGDDLTVFLDLYDLNSELSILIFTESNATTTTPEPTENYEIYTVLMQPISRERLLLAADGLWSNVTIELNEV